MGIGLCVVANSPEASMGGVVLDMMDRKHTKTRSARYKFRVQWDAGRIEWVSAGEIKPEIA